MSSPDSTISAADSFRLNTQWNGYRSMSPSISPLLYVLDGHVPKVMLERAVSPQHKDARLISTASISTVPFADNEFVSIPNCNDVRGFFSNRFRVMHSPSSLQVLLVAEELYRNIKIYFKDSCQNMIFDDQETLLNSNDAELRNDLCNEFESYCVTATILKERKLHVEFGHAPLKPLLLSNKFFKSSILEL